MAAMLSSLSFLLTLNVFLMSFFSTILYIVLLISINLLFKKKVCGMTKGPLDTRRLGGEIEMWKKWLPNERYVTKPGGNLNRLKINIL